jgi:glutathione S-transferase
MNPVLPPGPEGTPGAQSSRLRIWGRLSSINVRKVVWAAQEAGCPFDRIDAGAAFGIVDTPAFQRLNPNGLVPVLQHGGLTLWESNVIVRYLAQAFPGAGLLPATPARRIVAEQWMDWQQTTFNPAGRDAFVQWVRTPPAQRDGKRIERSEAATGPLLELLDAHLAAHEWVGGERFSVADIPLGCELHRWKQLPVTGPVTPQVDRWYAALLARPATRGVLDLQLS